METINRQMLNYVIIIFAFIIFALLILFGYDYFTSIQNRNIIDSKYYQSIDNSLKSAKINKDHAAMHIDSLTQIDYLEDTTSKKNIEEYIYRQYIDNLINEHFSSGLIKGGFLVLGIFTLIFTALTILINSYAAKTQNILSEVSKYEEKIIKLFEEVKILKEEINVIEIPNLRNKYENYIRILFVTLNGYLKEVYQLDSLTLLQILKLFGSDTTEVQEAAMLLSKSKDKKCVPFLKETSKYYEKLLNGTLEEKQKTLYNNILFYIKQAIEEIEK